MACTVGCRSSRAELVGRSYGLGPYAIPSKKLGLEINEMVEKVKKLVGIKESDTGLALPSLWDLAGDKQMMQEQQPLLVTSAAKETSFLF